MIEQEKENRIHSLALSFLERQQITPNLYADQIIRGYKEGYHQAEKDLKVKEVEEIPVSNDLEEAAASYPSAIHMVAPQWSNEVINAFKAGAKWMEQQLKDK